MSLSGVQGVDWSTRHNAYDHPTEPNDDCAHVVAEHWHGTHVCYVLDPCRCRDCAAANTAYEKLRSSWLGEFPKVPSPMVDADPTRAHVDRLVEAGMGRKRIAEMSGVPHGAIWKLMEGDSQRGTPPSRRVRRETAQAILDCPWTVADGAKVDPTEARAIVSELVARGWHKAEIARRITGNPTAKALQAVTRASRYVMAGKLRALRPLLDDDVPKRVHNVTGAVYQRHTSHRWRRIPPNTPGVPLAGHERPLAARNTPVTPDVIQMAPKRAPEPLVGKGKLRCQVCDVPVATHPLKRCWR